MPSPQLAEASRLFIERLIAGTPASEAATSKPVDSKSVIKAFSSLGLDAEDRICVSLQCSVLSVTAPIRFTDGKYRSEIERRLNAYSDLQKGLAVCLTLLRKVLAYKSRRSLLSEPEAKAMDRAYRALLKSKSGPTGMQSSGQTTDDVENAITFLEAIEKMAADAKEQEELS